MERKTKQGYSVSKNVGWMIQNAWKNEKSVIWFCLLLAFLGVLLNLVQLFIAPEILGKVEEGASISSLFTTVFIVFVAGIETVCGEKYIDWEGICSNEHCFSDSL